MAARILKYIFLFISGACLALIQFSFISAWSSPWNSLNLVVVALVVSFLVFNKNEVLWLAFTSGTLLDVFAFHPFGAALLSLFLTAVALYLILENILTNRSLYSFLLLTLIGVVLEALSYNLLLLIFDWSVSGGGRFFLLAPSFWQNMLNNILISLFLMIIFFNLSVLVNRRLQPFFLKRH